MDIRVRLKRTVPGDSLHTARNVSDHIMRRSEVKERPTLVKDHREPIDFKIRAVRRKIEPEPNAPQLIRLIRHPYSQEVARPTRKKMEVWTPEPRERVAFGHSMLDAVADAARAASASPLRHTADDRKPRLEVAMVLRHRAAMLEQP